MGMSHQWRRVYICGGSVVEVSGDCFPRVQDYLESFYDNIHHADDRIDWRVNLCRTAETLPAGHLEVVTNRWGVGAALNQELRTIHIVAQNYDDACAATRHAVRTGWLLGWEARGAVALHASSFLYAGRIVVLAGDKNHGKTTLALSAVAEWGGALISNDHLLCTLSTTGVDMVGLPTLIPVKPYTAARLAHVLPKPIESSPARDRHYFAFRQFDSVRLPVDIGSHPTVLVYPHFSKEGRIELMPFCKSKDELRSHARDDWFDLVARGVGVLPKEVRTTDDYRASTEAVVDRLANSCTSLRFAHTGDVTPLLAWLEANV